MVDLLERPRGDGEQMIGAINERPLRLSRFRWYVLGLIAVGITAIVLPVVSERRHVLVAASGNSQTAAASTRVALPPATADFSLLRTAANKPIPIEFLATIRRIQAQFALMPAKAREYREGIWLIPGRKGVCVLKRDSDGIGGGCGRLSAAEKYGVNFMERDRRSGRELWTIAAPDGTVRVRAITEDGVTMAVGTPQSSIVQLAATNADKVVVER